MRQQRSLGPEIDYRGPLSTGPMAVRVVDAQSLRWSRTVSVQITTVLDAPSHKLRQLLAKVFLGLFLRQTGHRPRRRRPPR